MRNLSICDIRLHPSTVDSDFEKAMVQEVLPGAGGAYPTDALFIRSLYRRVGADFPPGYRCVVHSDRAGDSEFFGLRPAIESLGAYTAEPRYRPLGGALPTDDAALSVARDRTAPGLVMVTVYLSRRLIAEQFEAQLDAALQEEVTVRTRANNTLAAFWTRDDSVVKGRIEYIVAALGQYVTEPRLREDTLQKISGALGVIVDSESFRHVGTVAGDPAEKD
jgi:hypothetical protein